MIWPWSMELDFPFLWHPLFMVPDYESAVSVSLANED